jgi:hypothetical protein
MKHDGAIVMRRFHNPMSASVFLDYFARTIKSAALAGKGEWSNRPGGKLHGLPSVIPSNCKPRRDPKPVKFCHRKTVNKTPVMVLHGVKLNREHEEYHGWAGNVELPPVEKKEEIRRERCIGVSAKKADFGERKPRF